MPSSLSSHAINFVLRGDETLQAEGIGHETPRLRTIAAVFIVVARRRMLRTRNIATTHLLGFSPMSSLTSVDPGGLASGAAGVQVLSHELHLDVGGTAVWADYLSVAGRSGVSAAVRAASMAMADRFTQQAGRIGAAAENTGAAELLDGVPQDWKAQVADQGKTIQDLQKASTNASISGGIVAFGAGCASKAAAAAVVGALSGPLDSAAAAGGCGVGGVGGLASDVAGICGNSAVG